MLTLPLPPNPTMGANDSIDRRRSEAEARWERWRWQRWRGGVTLSVIRMERATNDAYEPSLADNQVRTKPGLGASQDLRRLADPATLQCALTSPLCLHSAETNDAQSLASGLPVCCPAASATPHLWPACAALCLSPALRCPLCLSSLPASHSVERSAPGLQNHVF